MASGIIASSVRGKGNLPSLSRHNCLQGKPSEANNRRIIRGLSLLFWQRYILLVVQAVAQTDRSEAGTRKRRLFSNISPTALEIELLIRTYPKAATVEWPYLKTSSRLLTWKHKNGQYIMRKQFVFPRQAARMLFLLCNLLAWLIIAAQIWSVSFATCWKKECFKLTFIHIRSLFWTPPNISGKFAGCAWSNEFFLSSTKPIITAPWCAHVSRSWNTLSLTRVYDLVRVVSEKMRLSPKVPALTLSHSVTVECESVSSVLSSCKICEIFVIFISKSKKIVSGIITETVSNK